MKTFFLLFTFLLFSLTLSLQIYSSLKPRKMKNLILKSYLVIFLIFTFHSLGFAQAWEFQAGNTLPSNFGVFGISVVDENVVWSVAFDRYLGNVIPLDHVSKVLKTTDGGTTWEVIDVEEAKGRISFDIVGVNDSTAFITTQDYGNGSGRGIFKTTDGGETWIEIHNHTSGGVWLRFFNENDGVVINRQSIATTEDGGSTWEIVSNTNIPPFQSNEFTILINGQSSCNVVDNHIWFGTNKGRIYKSTNKGKNWDVMNTNLSSNGNISSIAFKDTLNGLMVGREGASYSYARTIDGGQTWVDLTPSFSLGVDMITNVPGSDGLFVGTTSQYVSTGSKTIYTSDFGDTWEEMDNVNIQHGPAQFLSQEVGWGSRGTLSQIISGQSTMLKWIGSDLISTSTKEIISSFQVTLNPNPVFDFLTIEINEKLSGDKFLFEIISLDGQSLKRWESIVLKKVKINLKDLPRGFYVLRIKGKNKTISKKIIKH